MRKTLLLALIIGFGFFSVAQNYSLKPNLKSEKAITAEKVAFEPAKAYPVGHAVKAELPDHNYKNTDFVNIISIGTSANAYSYANAGRSMLNVNNDLNTITNFHRMGGSLDPGGYSGDLGYDVSVDGGMTFTNQVECYIAISNAGGEYYKDAARYPNHGLYNPMGNTDPNEAYVTYFCPNLDGSNSPDSWGGYSYGRARIGDPSDTIRHLLPSHDEFYQYVPDAFCLTNLGEFWCADVNQDWSSGTVVYQGNVIMNRGTWNDETMDWELEQFLIDAETSDNSRPTFAKVEFAPDGLVGYMAILADNGEVPVSAGYSYFPIIFKTTDGGENWSDPFAIALAGEDGIGGVQNFLSDDELGELFEPPIPDREEIAFTTAFDFDMSVDAWGNPHIAVICGVTGSDAYSIVTGVSEITGYQFTAAFLLSSTDGGETFIGYECGRQKTFRGTFGDLTEDNRVQVARDPSGTKMFVSWIDTDLPGVTDNQQPDIWCRGVDIIYHNLTLNGSFEALPDNVTEFSEGMWQAYYAVLGNEALVSGDLYTLPFTYVQMNPEDPLEEVQYKYVQDFAYTDADFVYPGIDEDLTQEVAFEVTQNFPNPASGITTVSVSVEETTSLSFEVFNLMGQQVFNVPAQNYGSGVQTFTIDASNLSNGVYFYTVSSGETQVTRKMIVE